MRRLTFCTPLRPRFFSNRARWLVRPKPKEALAMKRRGFLAMSAAGALAIPGLSAGAASAAAATSGGPGVDDEAHGAPPDSLRALAAKIGLRIGTAVMPFDLYTPGYADVVVIFFFKQKTAYEMKWQVVEPQQGV